MWAAQVFESWRAFLKSARGIYESTFRNWFSLTAFVLVVSRNAMWSVDLARSRDLPHGDIFDIAGPPIHFKRRFARTKIKNGFPKPKVDQCSRIAAPE
jgi:hypothetical protein